MVLFAWPDLAGNRDVSTSGQDVAVLYNGGIVCKKGYNGETGRHQQKPHTRRTFEARHPRLCAAFVSGGNSDSVKMVITNGGTWKSDMWKRIKNIVFTIL